uniref:Uncharacterized protein n=1 Tax=Romanomermis culicivorax TaxID=13658 RepID=A0A915JCK9_ROMCU
MKLLTCLKCQYWNFCPQVLAQSTNAALDDCVRMQQNYDVTSMSLPSILLHSCLQLVIILSVTLLRRWPPKIDPLFRQMSPAFIDDFHNNNDENLRDFTSIIASQFAVYGSTLLFLNTHPLLCLWFSGRILGDQCRRVLPFTEKLWRSRFQSRNEGVTQEEDELNGDQRQSKMVDWSPLHSVNLVNNNEQKRRGPRGPVSKLLVRHASPGTIYCSEEMLPTSSSYGQWM